MWSSQATTPAGLRTTSCTKEQQSKATSSAHLSTTSNNDNVEHLETQRLLKLQMSIYHVTWSLCVSQDCNRHGISWYFIICYQTTAFQPRHGSSTTDKAMGATIYYNVCDRVRLRTKERSYNIENEEGTQWAQRTPLFDCFVMHERPSK